MNQNEFLDEILTAIRSLGITEGDRVYIASDVTGFLFRGARLCGARTATEQDYLLQGLLDRLKVLAGKKGTLLIPMYSWTFCKGIAFDVRTTPSEVGSLGNYALSHDPAFRRTWHPIYSFLVAGADRELLLKMKNEDSWGKDSPFGYLHQNKGKMLLFDVKPSQCNTFEHYVEQCIGVPYRYHKEFIGDYRDENGTESRRACRMFVRDLSVISAASETNDIFYLENQVMKETECRGIGLGILDLSASFPLIAKDLLTNNGRNIYRFENYEIDWTIAQTHPDERKVRD